MVGVVRRGQRVMLEVGGPLKNACLMWLRIRRFHEDPQTAENATRITRTRASQVFKSWHICYIVTYHPLGRRSRVGICRVLS